MNSEELKVVGERLSDLAFERAKILFRSLDMQPVRSSWHSESMSIEIEFRNYAKKLTIPFANSDLQGVTGLETGEKNNTLRPLPYEDAITVAIDNFKVSELRSRNKE